MTDRELLELAAKAAGIGGAWSSARPGMRTLHSHSEDLVWNPLTDDGDALRLAVRLDLTTRHYSGSTIAQSGAPGTPCAYEEESNHADPCAAARRAIVRAAAAIGQAMSDSAG